MQHAIQRAKERLGLELSPQDILAINRRIYDGESLKLGDMEDGRERHLLFHKNANLVLIWQRYPWPRVITILPPKAGFPDFRSYIKEGAHGAKWKQIRKRA